LNKNTTHEIHLNNNTKIIPSFTFEHFLSLKEVQLPFNLEKIESKAFYYCKNLLTVNIPDNCKDVSSDSFYGCMNLKNITCSIYLKDKFKSHIKIYNKIEIEKKDLRNNFF